MPNSLLRAGKKAFKHSLRHGIANLPRDLRFALYRSFVECDPHPDERLVLKIAETQEELEACFRLLHDAYVSSGFMKPDPSGMRLSIYHALPTTTTLCAKYDGQVVGTISLIRESVFGFPLQSIFDLTRVRQQSGNIAEVSALAVDPSFRKTGGMILFPLMKFMYGYCTSFFDTRHLLIAVNPDRIDLYESLLFFQRLSENVVASYDFANGAPAVGASLDLYQAPGVFERAYGHKADQKNLYKYFVKTVLPNIVLPNRRYFTTNDPVMTADLLDYFFNQKSPIFQALDTRKKRLLHAIYNLESYRRILPAVPAESSPYDALRQHQRYSVSCPGVFHCGTVSAHNASSLQIVELSEYGFQAIARDELPLKTWGDAQIELGSTEHSSVKVMAVRRQTGPLNQVYGFRLGEPDEPWRKFVHALALGTTHDDLEHASRFLAV